MRNSALELLGEGVETGKQKTFTEKLFEKGKAPVEAPIEVGKQVLEPLVEKGKGYEVRGVDPLSEYTLESKPGEAKGSIEAPKAPETSKSGAKPHFRTFSCETQP